MEPDSPTHCTHPLKTRPTCGRPVYPGRTRCFWHCTGEDIVVRRIRYLQRQAGRRAGRPKPRGAGLSRRGLP